MKNYQLHLEKDLTLSEFENMLEQIGIEIEYLKELETEIDNKIINLLKTQEVQNDTE